MKAQTTLNQLRAQAERLGLVLDTHCPGDGKRRFAIQDKAGHRMGFAIGLREAELFLDGYRMAIDFPTPEAKRIQAAMGGN